MSIGMRHWRLPVLITESWYKFRSSSQHYLTSQYRNVVTRPNRVMVSSSPNPIHTRLNLGCPWPGLLGSSRAKKQREETVASLDWTSRSKLDVETLKEKGVVKLIVSIPPEIAGSGPL
jgi:hypothetical protein